MRPETRRAKARTGKGLRTIPDDARRSELDRLGHIFIDAHLRVPIADEFPLERAADAHRRIEQGHVLGRIGLRIHRQRR